jgi:hypothetical protein
MILKMWNNKHNVKMKKERDNVEILESDGSYHAVVWKLNLGLRTDALVKFKEQKFIFKNCHITNSMELTPS